MTAFLLMSRTSPNLTGYVKSVGTTSDPAALRPKTGHAGQRTGVVPKVLSAWSVFADWLTPYLTRQGPAVTLPAASAANSEPSSNFGKRPHPSRRNTGQISLVGAGPGARDLLTLRALNRLQEADVIFYDRLVETDVLDFARPEAERIFVGKHVGAHAWPQERINQVIVAEALKGKRVVRLKSGDPGIFGRATEEIAAARAAGIPVELVPGVTAATAAGAALGQSLTERDVSDVLVFATGTGCASDPMPDTTRLSGPGTTTVVYMGVRQAARLAADLMRRGMPADSQIDIAVEVSKPSERHIKTNLANMAQVLRDTNTTGSAVIIITWPKAPSDPRLGACIETDLASQSETAANALALT